jgi:hypothetical protein
MDTSFRMPIDMTYGEYEERSEKQLQHYFVSLEGFDRNEKFGPEFFEKLIAEAVHIAEERDVPLYCGEFGVIDLASPEDTLEWYRMICSVFDKHGIGRAAWSYKAMDFGFTDGRLEGVINEIVRLV